MSDNEYFLENRTTNKDILLNLASRLQRQFKNIIHLVVTIVTDFIMDSMDSYVCILSFLWISYKQKISVQSVP